MKVGGGGVLNHYCFCLLYAGRLYFKFVKSVHILISSGTVWCSECDMYCVVKSCMLFFKARIYCGYRLLLK